MSTAYTTIITPADLAGHLDDPAWVVIDCRAALADPDWGLRVYHEGHIPGARFADLNRQLAAPATPQTGRHPLPRPAEFAEHASQWGIDSGVQVVVYDAAGGSFAVRCWWLLRYFGHSAVAVLEGGLPRWVAEGRPLSSETPLVSRRAFTAQPRPEMAFSAADVDRVRLDPAWKVIDARAPERFRGESETIDPIAGHIPGAVNRFHGLNLSADGNLLPAAALREQFLALLAGAPAEKTVVYCGSGVTSIHHLLALEIAGLPGAKLYPGSWSEWIRDPNRPVATGE